MCTHRCVQVFVQVKPCVVQVPYSIGVCLRVRVYLVGWLTAGARGHKNATNRQIPYVVRDTSMHITSS